MARFGGWYLGHKVSMAQPRAMRSWMGTGPGHGGSRFTDPNTSTGASVTPLWDLHPQDVHGCIQHTAQAHTPALGSGTCALLPSALASHPTAREQGEGNKHSTVLTTVVILCIRKPENTPVSVDM